MSDSPPDFRYLSLTWPIDLEPTDSTVVLNPSTPVEIQPTQRDQEPFSTTRGPRNNRKNPWGNLTYVEIITQAISSSLYGRMMLSEIYTWMINNFDYFRKRSSSSNSGRWKNSVRHNLSIHKRFLKIPNETPGMSSWWVIDNDAINTTPPRPWPRNRIDNNIQNASVPETENTAGSVPPLLALDGAFQSTPNTRRSFRSRVTPSHTFWPYQLNYSLQQQPNPHPDCQYHQQIYQQNTTPVNVPVALPPPLENLQEEQINWRRQQPQNPQENKHPQEGVQQPNNLAAGLQEPFTVTYSNHRLQDIQYQQTDCQPKAVFAKVHQSSSPIQAAVMRQQPQVHQHRPQLDHHLEVQHKTNQQPPLDCQQQQVHLEVKQKPNLSEASTSIGQWMTMTQQTHNPRYNPPVNISGAVPQKQLHLEDPQISNQQQPQISQSQQCPPQQHLALKGTQEPDSSEPSTITSQRMIVSPERRQQLNGSLVILPVKTPQNLNLPESESDLSAFLKMYLP